MADLNEFRHWMRRLRAILLVMLFALLGVGLLFVSLVGAVGFLIGGLGFASPEFIVLSLICVGLLIFTVFFSIKVLIPFSRLLLFDK